MRGPLTVVLLPGGERVEKAEFRKNGAVVILFIINNKARVC
jgi:hypothetical protein